MNKRQFNARQLGSNQVRNVSTVNNASTRGGKIVNAAQTDNKASKDEDAENNPQLTQSKYNKKN